MYNLVFFKNLPIQTVGQKIRVFCLIDVQEFHLSMIMNTFIWDRKTGTQRISNRKDKSLIVVLHRRILKVKTSPTCLKFSPNSSETRISKEEYAFLAVVRIESHPPG
jgi:hypothetical protein